MGDQESGTAPKQPRLAETYARSTSVSWLSVAVTRVSSLIWIKVITQEAVMSRDVYGFVAFVALGASLVAGLAVPWLVYVMSQRALANKDRESATRFIHQMVTYGIIVSLVFAPLLALTFLFVASLVIGPQILALPGILMLIPITIAASLFQLFVGVYQAFLKIERNIGVAAARTVAYNMIPLALFLVTRNVLTIFLGWVIADALILCIMIPTCGLQRRASLYRPKPWSKELVIFTLPILLYAMFSAFRSIIDGFFAYAFFGSADFATYHVVTRVTSIASEAILTLAQPFMPIMVVLLRTRPERTGIALGTVVKMLAHGVVYSSFILVFCGGPIMGLITDSPYVTPVSVTTLSVAVFMMTCTVFNVLLIALIGAKGQTYRYALFQAAFALWVLPFYALFLIAGWFQSLGIIGIAASTALGFFVTLCLLVWQTKELAQVGRRSLMRVLALVFPQAGVTFMLSAWLAPIDIPDLALILGLTFASIFVFSGFLSCFKRDELEIVSRASRGKLDRLIRFYQRLGRSS